MAGLRGGGHHCPVVTLSPDAMPGPPGRCPVDTAACGGARRRDTVLWPVGLGERVSELSEDSRQDPNSQWNGGADGIDVYHFHCGSVCPVRCCLLADALAGPESCF